jgi:hypothetical protein
MVPFDLLRLNVGNAMSTTGIFVTPKTGKYLFALSGLTEEHKSANVEMQVKTATADWDRRMVRPDIKHIQCKPR